MPDTPSALTRVRDYLVAHGAPDELLKIVDESMIREEAFEVLASAHLSPLRQKPAARPAPARKAEPTGVHRIKVTLIDSKPPIWRTLEVPSGRTFHGLHNILQAAFGWNNSHLWVFETPAGSYGPDEDGDLGLRNPTARKLVEAAPQPGDQFVYVYDYGDYWDHQVVVEDVFEAEPGVRYPRAIAGELAAPPDDCGGLGGYAYLCEVLADPAHEQHQWRLDWLGLDSADEFDPAVFDLDAVNKWVSKGAKVLRKS